MDKNALYLAVFAVLCVLLGVLVGANITKRSFPPFPGPGSMEFRDRAEHFMGFPPHGSGRMMGKGPIEMFTMTLDLNSDQQEEISKILENTRQRIDDVGQNARNSLDQIRGETDKEIMSILTPEQQRKFNEIKKKFGKGAGLRGPMGGPGSCPGEDMAPRN